MKLGHGHVIKEPGMAILYNYPSLCTLVIIENTEMK